MLSAFFKDSAVYTVPTLLTRGLALILVPLYTRVLSPADYGSLDLLTVFASIINLTIALEVSQGVARFYTAEEDSENKMDYASSAFWFTVVCYSIFAVVMLISTDLVEHWVLGQQGLSLAYQLGIAYIWSNGIFNLIQNQFRWELRSREYAIVSLIMSFTTAGISVLLAYGLKWGLEGLLAGMVAGSVSGSGLGLIWLRNSFRLRFNVVKLKEMLKFSSPLVFSGIAVWVSLYIDRLMINHFLSIDEVGLYGIGHRLASVAGIVMVGFQSALTPLVLKNYRESDTPYQLARIFRMFLTFALGLFLALTLFANDIIRLLTTEAFYGGSVVVIYLIPAVLLANMYIFAPGISIAKKTHFFIWINSGGAILNIALNYFMIPAFGIVGAGVATLLAYLAVFAAHMILSQRFYTVPHQWRRIVIVVFIGGILAWFSPLLPLGDLQRWCFNVTVLMFFGTLMLVLGMIQLSELQNGVQWIRSQYSQHRSNR